MNIPKMNVFSDMQQRAEEITTNLDISSRKSEGITPLIEACTNGDYDLVTSLLEEEGADINEKDKDGYSPLTWAFYSGFPDIVSLLLNKGADINNTEKTGHSPLMWACQNGNSNIVSLLLNKGIDINQADKDGYTPLMWACYNAHLDIVNLLLNKGANIHVKTETGKNALYILCSTQVKHPFGDYDWEYENNVYEIAKKLVELGIDVESTSTEYLPYRRCRGIPKEHTGCTILMAVIIRKKLTSVADLLIKNGANVNAVNNSGRTALIYAAMGNDAELVKLLLIAGANKEQFDMYGHDACYYGFYQENVAIMKMLMRDNRVYYDVNDNIEDDDRCFVHTY